MSVRKKARRKVRFWTNKEGRRIAVHKLNDKHLENIIKMLERGAEDAAESMDYPAFNGDMAQFYAEKDYENIQRDSTRLLAGTIYEALVEERDKRKKPVKKSNKRITDSRDVGRIIKRVAGMGEMAELQLRNNYDFDEQDPFTLLGEGW